MKDKKIFLLIGLGFLGLILAYFFIYLGHYKNEKQKILEENTLSVSIVVDYGNDKASTTEKVLNNAGRTDPYTAFDALNGAFDIKAVEYNWGTSITCINDKCEDESAGYYWFFWPNGNFSSVSVEKYYLKNNDVISMKFIKASDVGM